MQQLNWVALSLLGSIDRTFPIEAGKAVLGLPPLLHGSLQLKMAN
jgi:hypothetical protein